jgi:hypothetical protein
LSARSSTALRQPAPTAAETGTGAAPARFTAT